MISRERLRAGLGAAVSDADGGLSAADSLCMACVELLGVDGAAISLFDRGATRGTFGSSNALSKQLDEFQFTFGEGPCVDAVLLGRPVLAADIGHANEARWPAFAGAALDLGVRAVFALPVEVASARVGALDLFRSTPGSLGDDGLLGGLLAAELAALPLLDLMGAKVDWAAAGDGGAGWAHLASLERVEVYQATGMIMAELDVGSAEALVRLRAHAFAQGLTASEVAWSIIERQVVLSADEPWGGSGGAAGPS